MFAIIQSGGRQVKVSAGRAWSRSIASRPEPGTEVAIDRVLFLEKDGGEMLAGAPFVANAKVTGVVDGEERVPRSASSRRSAARASARHQGHRATYTRVRITGIEV